MARFFPFQLVLLSILCFDSLLQSSVAFQVGDSSYRRIDSFAFTAEGSLHQTTTTESETTLSTVNDNKKGVSISPSLIDSDVQSPLNEERTSSGSLHLTPSYELFQLLNESEGGTKPALQYGNRLELPLFPANYYDDPHQGLQLSDYVSDPERIQQAFPDPFALVHDELQPITEALPLLVESHSSPLLTQAAQHLLQRPGKRVRPTLVLLLARSLGTTPTTLKHKQLAQIVELIHTASLLHDDVLDESDTRRHAPTVHALMKSTKVAVLAGDYLLARASLLLAQLQDTNVLQCMATALECLVTGEVMQLQQTRNGTSSKCDDTQMMTLYLQTCYSKTASLMGYACRSVSLLSGFGYDTSIATTCEEIGYHLGLAYQVQDDVLDMSGTVSSNHHHTSTSSTLGKPMLADMRLGLATAPLLYAAQEDRTLLPLIRRRFQLPGDLELAIQKLLLHPRSMARANQLALFHAQKAVDAVLRLPPSEARDALVRLIHIAVTRKK